MGPNWSSPTFPSSTCQNSPGIFIYFPRCPSILKLTRTTDQSRGRLTLSTVDENYKLTLNLVWRSSTWTIQLQEWQNIILTAGHYVQKLKTTRIVKPIIPYDKQIKTNQTLQTWDFREYFILPGERYNSIMSHTSIGLHGSHRGHAKLAPNFRTGFSHFWAQSRNAFLGPIYAASRSDKDDGTLRISTQNVFREKFLNTASIFEASWTAEPNADTRIATGPVGLVKIDNASRIYGSTINFVFQFVRNDSWPRTHACGTSPRTVGTTWLYCQIFISSSKSILTVR